MAVRVTYASRAPLRLHDRLTHPARRLWPSPAPARIRVRDWGRIDELVGTYADLCLGGTDASVITIAQRRAVNRIATLNRRHSGVVRPRHITAFELVPELN